MHSRSAVTFACIFALATSGIAASAGPTILHAAAGEPAAATAVVAAQPTRAQTEYAVVSRQLTGASRSRYLGANFSGQVIDLESGATLWSHNDDQTRMPASTQKILTAHTALASMAPSTRLVTTVRQDGSAAANIYLTGAGDPSLTNARLHSLAAQTARALKTQRRTSVRLYVDASAFPTASNATGWRRTYVPDQVQPVRGLTVAGYHGLDNDLAAGQVFRSALVANGIAVPGLGRATAAESATVLAESSSAPVSTMVAHMLLVSDNTYAEYLLRLAARAAGHYPTWENALAHQRQLLTHAGIPTDGQVSADGSGLSRANRMPAATLTATLRALYQDPTHRAVVFAPGALPVAGKSGTLLSRFATAGQRCARTRVQAKTGTLDDVISLAGVARDTNGTTRVFAFMENGRTDGANVRVAMDQVATVLTGCR